MINYAKLESRLAGCEIGHTVYTYAQCLSTQDIAHSISASHRSGTLIFAEHQTAGRGRQSRIWTDQRGQTLATSFLLKLPLAIGNAAPTSLLAGMAVLDTISSLLPEIGESLWLKWPNDIVWRSPDGSLRKLAGILVERHYLGATVKHAVLGIGVNVNQTAEGLPKVDSPSLAPTSLHILAGEHLDRFEVLENLCQQLACRLSSKGMGLLLDKPWEEKMITLGQRVVVHPSTWDSPKLEGIAKGTTMQGNLVIEDPTGNCHEITANDVTILG